jgi:dual specificity phosphatase 12
MKAKRLPAGEALAALQARAPGAAPNPGFMAQLELWGEMGCAIEEGHPGYKQFMLAQVRVWWREGKARQGTLAIGN